MDEPIPYTTPENELLNLAWGVIANAGWGNQTDEWMDAARSWRDKYHQYLGLAPLPSDEVIETDRAVVVHNHTYMNHTADDDEWPPNGCIEVQVLMCADNAKKADKLVERFAGLVYKDKKFMKAGAVVGATYGELE